MKKTQNIGAGVTILCLITAFAFWFSFREAKKEKPKISEIVVASEESVIEPADVVDGVYLTHTWHSYVIELKKGRFRYWFSSDAMDSEVERLEGPFDVEGTQVVLSHPKLPGRRADWEVLSIDGVVTLWRSDAIRLRKEGKLHLYSQGKESFFKFGGGSILVPSKLSVEEAWVSSSPLYGNDAFDRRVNRGERKLVAEQVSELIFNCFVGGGSR